MQAAANYQFSFTKKRMFWIGASFVFAGLLIFLCGVVAGIGLGVPTGVQLALPPASTPGAAPTNNSNNLARALAIQSALRLPLLPGQSKATALANNPLVRVATAPPVGTAPAQSAAPGAVVSGQPTPAQTAPGAVVAPPAAAAAQPPSNALAPAGAQPAAPTPANTTASAPAAPVLPGASAAATAPAAGATAPPAAGAVPAADAADQPFVLQLGAFQEQKDAVKLKTELATKGIVTTIFNMLDEDQRTWHMVRFGGFKSMDEASKAASDLNVKQGIQAFVKRADSL